MSVHLRGGVGMGTGSYRDGSTMVYHYTSP